MWTIAWPLYSRSLAANWASSSSGMATMTSSTSSTRACGSAKARAPPARPANRSRRVASRLATAWTGQPARVRASGQRAADRTAADDAGGRALAGLGVLMRVLMAVGVDLVAVAVVSGRGRIEVDAGGLDGRLGLRAVALGVVTRERAPRLHRRPAAAVGRSRYASTQRV